MTANDALCHICLESGHTRWYIPVSAWSAWHSCVCLLTSRWATFLLKIRLNVCCCSVGCTTVLCCVWPQCGLRMSPQNTINYVRGLSRVMQQTNITTTRCNNTWTSSGIKWTEFNGDGCSMTKIYLTLKLVFSHVQHLSGHLRPPHCAWLSNPPGTSVLGHCDPITLSRLQYNIKNTTLQANASSSVCCLLLCFHYLPWIPRKLIHHNDLMLVGRGSSLHSALGLRSFAPLVAVPQCVRTYMCVGCSRENKGFAGIIPLQQTKGCSKLGVAPSDTWSARNLGAAQRAGEGTAFV